MDAANDYDSEFETNLGYVAKSTGAGQVYFNVMRLTDPGYMEGPQVRHSNVIRYLYLTPLVCRMWFLMLSLSSHRAVALTLTLVSSQHQSVVCTSFPLQV